MTTTINPDTLTADQVTEMSTQELVNLAAAHPGAAVDGPADRVTEIYWDSQDPANVGPAYRVGTAPHQESGALEFAGWSSDEGTDDYDLGAFFDGDGGYLGPDSMGVHPTFSVA